MTGDGAARLKELDKKEEMMRVGKVVKIEPIHVPVVPPPLPAGVLNSEMTRDDRLKIATRIVDRSNQALSTVERQNHIALKIGTGPYSNAVMVTDSYVKFLIRSEDLRNRAKEEGFNPEEVIWKGPWAGFGYRFRGLRLNDIQEHEGFFKAVVQESINEIGYRKEQGKN